MNAIIRKEPIKVAHQSIAEQIYYTYKTQLGPLIIFLKKKPQLESLIIFKKKKKRS